MAVLWPNTPPNHWTEEPRIYLEHDNTPFKCNHDECNGILIIDYVGNDYVARGLLAGYVHCENCGQRYYTNQPREWYTELKQEQIIRTAKQKEARYNEFVEFMQRYQRENNSPVTIERKAPEQISKRENFVTIKI